MVIRIAVALTSLFFWTLVSPGWLSHSSIGHSRAETVLACNCELNQHTAPDSWVIELPRHLDHQGKVNENTVESTVSHASSVYLALLSAGQMEHSLVLRHCIRIYTSQISPLRLRRLIFPFHSFW